MLKHYKIQDLCIFSRQLSLKKANLQTKQMNQQTSPKTILAEQQMLCEWNEWSFTSLWVENVSPTVYRALSVGSQEPSSPCSVPSSCFIVSPWAFGVNPRLDLQSVLEYP